MIKNFGCGVPCLATAAGVCVVCVCVCVYLRGEGGGGVFKAFSCFCDVSYLHIAVKSHLCLPLTHCCNSYCDTKMEKKIIVIYDFLPV